MGLCGSKAGAGKGAEPSRCPCPVAKPERRPAGGPPREPEPPAAAKPAHGPSRSSGAAPPRRASREAQEKPDVRVKSSKKVVIPQITITTVSNETLISDAVGSEEQTTIREQAEWGAYSRHRNPSTVDAFNLQTKE